MRLSKAVEGFTTVKLGDGFSQNTIRGYKDHYNQMIQFLGDIEIESLTPEDIARFFAWLRSDYIPKRQSKNEAPLKTTTIRNAWCAVRSLFNWYSDISSNKRYKRPDMLLKRPIASYPEIVPLKHEEIDSILKACLYTRDSPDNGEFKVYKKKRPTALRDTLLILMLLDTGLRVSELASLKIGDLNNTSGEVYVLPINSARKNKPRTVYIGTVTKKALWRYISSRDDNYPSSPLFLSEENHPMNRNSIRLVVTKLGKKANVQHVYPHRFRHTFAIEFLRNGGDIFTLQRLLGHSTLNMVQHYLNLAQTDIEKAHRLASPVDRWHL